MADRHPVKVIAEQCRDIVSRHLPEYEKTIGLTAPNGEFRSKLTDAIVACTFQHILMPFLKRPSSWRKELTQVSKEARTARNSLRRLAEILDGLPQQLSDQFAHRSLKREISWLEQVSFNTSMYAKCLKTGDQGGAPKMLAFRVLANGLADAYRIAAGRRGITWNEHHDKYEGQYLELVQAVVPLAMKLAEMKLTEMPPRPLRVPKGKYALGKYLDVLTPRRARKKKRIRPGM